MIGDRSGERSYWMIYAAFFLVSIGCWVAHSYYESETYNRLTGAHTTWWDAMWVELRVQDAPRGGNR